MKYASPLLLEFLELGGRMFAFDPAHPARMRRTTVTMADVMPPFPPCPDPDDDGETGDIYPPEEPVP